MPGKSEIITIAGRPTPVRYMDRLVAMGEMVNVKLTDRAILIDPSIHRNSFVAGLRAAESINQTRRGVLAPVLVDVD